MTNVTVELISVYCSNTEDVTGGDEFYLVGLALGDPDLRSPILTTPMSVNDGQVKTFGAESLLFKGEVPVDSHIALYLQAYDEDFAKDWAKRPSWVDKMAEASAAQLSAGAAAALLTNPAGWAIVATCALAAAGIGGFYLAGSGDKDDELGSLRALIPVRGYSEENRQWSFQRSGGWSGWNYTVRFRIRRIGAGVTPTPKPLPRPPRPPRPDQGPGRVQP
jgi:hypothetical protein